MAEFDWNTAKTAFEQNQTPFGAWTGQNYNDYQTVVQQNVNDFASQFENLVGRAPTQDEIGKFVSNYVVPNTRNLTDPNSSQRQQGGSFINQFVGQNFQNAAKDYATQQLEGQQGEANRLADLYRTQGNNAISGIEQQLLDYQSKLFDKLRPNLLTSLKAQGLLDTGGLNEAIAGKQGDLANEASNYLAQLKYQNEMGANDIAFGGASAPYYYKQGIITQQPEQMFAQGQNALNFNNQMYMSNLDYAHQLGLIQAQQQNKPSFLTSLGHNMLTGFSNAFNPLSATEAYKNYGTGYNQYKQGAKVG